MTKRIVLVFLIILGLAQFSFSQNTSAETKEELVKQLVAQTAEIFPAQEIVKIFNDLNEKQRGEMEKELKDSLTNKIDKSSLTSSRKIEIKEKIPNLIKRYSEVINGIVTKDFKVETWVENAFNKHYLGSFSIGELKELNDYFKTQEGEEIINLFNKTIISGMQEKEEELEVPEEDAIVMAKFLQNSFGEKFSEILMENVFADIMGQIDHWSNQFTKDFEKEVESGSIKDLIDEFLSANQIA